MSEKREREQPKQLTMDRAAEHLARLNKRLEGIETEIRTIHLMMERTIEQLNTLSTRLLRSVEEAQQIRSQINDLLTLAQEQNWRLMAKADNVKLPPGSDVESDS